MPLQVPLDVPVNDDRFRAFLDLFERYKEALGRVPGDWGKVNAASGEVATGFAGMTAALLAQAELLRRIESEERRVAHTTTGVGRAFHEAARGAKEVYDHVAGTTRMLLRWTGISGLLGTLTAGFSVYGIDRLAAGATTLQTSALARGVPPTTLLALRETFGTFGDVDAGLNNIRNLQQTLTPAFGILGINSNPNDPAGTYVSAITRIRQLYRSSDPSTVTMQPWWQWATQILPADQIRAYGALSDQQFNQQTQRFGQYRQDFGGISQHVLDSARSVTQTLEHVGHVLEYKFLAALDNKHFLDALEKLATKVGDTVASFLDGPGFDNLVTLVTDAMQRLSDWMGSKTFQADIKRFSDDIGLVAKGLDNLLTWMTKYSWIFGDLGAPAVGAAVGSRFGPLGAVAGAMGGIGVEQLGRSQEAKTWWGRVGEMGPPIPGGFVAPWVGHLLQNWWSGGAKTAPPPPAGTAPGPSGALALPPSDNFSVASKANVTYGDEPLLALAAQRAAAGLPPGYSVQITEGYNPRGHVPNSQHHLGRAIDIKIFDPSGHGITNYGPDVTGMYGRFNRLMQASMAQIDPDAARHLRWGGVFGDNGGPIGPGSPADLMHFDLKDFAGNADAAIRRFRASIARGTETDTYGGLRSGGALATAGAPSVSRVDVRFTNQTGANATVVSSQLGSIPF